MSTKIYRGLRFKLDFIALHHALMEWRKHCLAYQNEKVIELMARKVVYKIDKAAVENRIISSPLSDVFLEICDEKAEVDETQRRNPEVDFDFSVSILPYGNEIYGIAYTEQHELARQFMELDWVESYAYWDNSDRDENVSEAEWEERGRIWGEISNADPYGRPSGCGFNADCSFPIVNWPDAEKILQKVPSLEDRIRRIAYDVATERRIREIQSGVDANVAKSRYIRDFLEAHKWSKEPDGLQAIAVEAANIRDRNILPVLTKHILLGTWSGDV